MGNLFGSCPGFVRPPLTPVALSEAKGLNGQILRYAAHEQICSLPCEWRPASSGTQNDTREGSRGENRSAQVLDMSHPFISCSCRRQWPWYAALVVLLVSSGLLTDSVGAEERTQP